MKMADIQSLVRKRGEAPGRRSKMGLVRHLQQAEGNPECFSPGQAACCGQDVCLWRGDCA